MAFYIKFIIDLLIMNAISNILILLLKSLNPKIRRYLIGADTIFVSTLTLKIVYLNMEVRGASTFSCIIVSFLYTWFTIFIYEYVIIPFTYKRSKIENLDRKR